MHKQRGYINIPEGFFETVFFLAGVGVIALIFWLGYIIYWLFTHVKFV